MPGSRTAHPWGAGETSRNWDQWPCSSHPTPPVISMDTFFMSMAPSPQSFEPARIVIVMGVSSSGKSTVGAALGRALHAPFLDGDKYHPAANVEKMRAGTPLTDEDRWPWLEALAAALKEAAEKKKGVAVGACSALKRAYRD